MSLPGLAMILPFYDVRYICIIYDLVKLSQVKPVNLHLCFGKIESYGGLIAFALESA